MDTTGQTFEVRIDEQTFRIGNSAPTGKDLLALVDRSPVNFLLTLVVANAPDRLVDPEETIDISAPGAEQFALVSKAKFYSFRIDEKAFDLPNRSPTGRQLLELVHKSPEDHLLTLSLKCRDDEIIAPDQMADLSLPGQEQFYVVAKPLSIIIDDLTYYPPRANMTGSELRALPDPPVPTKRDLWLDVPGKDDLRIRPEDPVHVVSGMVFYTSPGKINPGGYRDEIA